MAKKVLPRCPKCDTLLHAYVGPCTDELIRTSNLKFDDPDDPVWEEISMDDQMISEGSYRTWACHGCDSGYMRSIEGGEKELWERQINNPTCPSCQSIMQKTTRWDMPVLVCPGEKCNTILVQQRYTGDA